MPNLRNYDIFVSHAWKYGEEYDRLMSLIDNQILFKYRNYSAPIDKPLIPAGVRVPSSVIAEKLENKIKAVNAFLIISGMYYHYKEWIQFEVEIAKKYNKPIIVIKPWGHERVPVELQNIGTVVGWNGATLVSTIRSLAI